MITACGSGPSGAAPYAALVMDARSGETLYAKNADARLHPASLTKMLTLYIAFEAIQRGEITLDTVVTVSKNAASEPPSRLGLKPGQKIAMRHLIRAAAIKSANDAATAIGEAIGGSEAKFAARMNRTAKAIGMRNSSFKNANGLTESGHLSTARDMTILGRRLFYDFPQYYNIFSRRSTDAGLAEVANTNRRFLDAYEGADGIKTGYTQAAGFNLTASAQRGNKRIIATVFGGTSTAQRNAKMKELMDLGFREAPANTPVQKPATPVLTAEPEVVPDEALPETDLVASASGNGTMAAGKTIRLIAAVAASPRPRQRPGETAPETAVAAAIAPATDDAMQSAIASALAEATDAAVAEALGMAITEPVDTASAAAVAVAPPTPETFEAQLASIGQGLTAPAEDPPAGEAAETVQLAALTSSPRPAAKPKPVIIHTASLTGPAAKPAAADETEVVTRVSTSGGRHWGVNVGRFASRGQAERALMKTALAESATLNDGLQKVIQRGGKFDANFMGLTQEQADLACRKLQARGTQCFSIGP